MISVGFVLFAGTTSPEPKRIEAAAREFGWLIRSDGSDSDSKSGAELSDTTTMSFASEEQLSCIVGFIPSPLPDRQTIQHGPTSPRIELTTATRSHAVVTVMSQTLSAEVLNIRLLALLAAVIDAGADPIGAITHNATVVHQAALVSDFAKLAMREGVMPAEMAVDVTVAREPEDRMSFLTHGLHHYGREEFFITCSPRGKGALEFLFMMVGWMLAEPDKVLPTGDTVGRTAEEKIRIQRVENPARPDQQAIRLNLP